MDEISNDPATELLFYTGISGLGGVVAVAWYIIDLKRDRKYVTYIQFILVFIEIYIFFPDVIKYMSLK